MVTVNEIEVLKNEISIEINKLETVFINNKHVIDTKAQERFTKIIEFNHSNVRILDLIKLTLEKANGEELNMIELSIIDIRKSYELLIEFNHGLQHDNG